MAQLAAHQEPSGLWSTVTALVTEGFKHLPESPMQAFGFLVLVAFCGGLVFAIYSWRRRSAVRLVELEETFKVVNGVVGRVREDVASVVNAIDQTDLTSDAQRALIDASFASLKHSRESELVQVPKLLAALKKTDKVASRAAIAIVCLLFGVVIVLSIALVAAWQQTQAPTAITREPPSERLPHMAGGTEMNSTSTNASTRSPGGSVVGASNAAPQVDRDVELGKDKPDGAEGTRHEPRSSAACDAENFMLRTACQDQIDTLKAKVDLKETEGAICAKSLDRCTIDYDSCELNRGLCLSQRDSCRVTSSGAENSVLECQRVAAACNTRRAELETELQAVKSLACGHGCVSERLYQAALRLQCPSMDERK